MCHGIGDGDGGQTFAAAKSTVTDMCHRIGDKEMRSTFVEKRDKSFLAFGV